MVTSFNYTVLHFGHLCLNMIRHIYCTLYRNVVFILLQHTIEKNICTILMLASAVSIHKFVGAHWKSHAKLVIPGKTGREYRDVNLMTPYL